MAVTTKVNAGVLATAAGAVAAHSATAYSTGTLRARGQDQASDPWQD
ncbi:MAG TPA: hypothetical protein VFE59_43205 [Trebonia sp.]|jgi:hypothetical protein|nr:hypothetical protein [Trebonia sp.]